MVRALVFTFIGALLSAGMGYATYAELPEVMSDAAALMTSRSR
jgi:hypothetical protein